MSKALKIFAALAGLVVALIVLAAVVLPMVVDPNDYRDEIAARVEAATGRPMEIEGELELSVIPWLGVEIGGVRLGNPAGFGDAPFVGVESAAVGARLLPLLSRRLEVSRIRLEGLRVHLVRLEDGRGNWQGLGGAGADPAAGAGDSAGEDGGAAFTFAGVGGLEVVDASVRFEDRAAGTTVEALVPRLDVGALTPGQPFPVDGELLVSTGEPPTRLTVAFEARVEPAPDFSGATLSSVEIDGAAEPAGGGRQVFSLTIPQARLDASAMSVNLSDLAASASLEPAGGGVGHEIGLSAPSVAVDLERQALAVPEIGIEAAGVSAGASLEGTNILDAPRFTGGLRVREFSPRALLERLGAEAPRTADDSVLRTARIDARFAATPDEIALEGIELALDDTLVTGRAEVGPGEPLRIEAKLGVDAIDLDRYLPPPAEGEAGPSEGGAETELAFDWLDGIALDASLGIGRLRVAGLTMTEVSARAVARDGVLTLSPLDAALYGGTVRGGARLDARESPATFSLDQSLGSLQLGPFVADLAEFDRLAGTAALNADLETRAFTTAGLLSGLNGTLAFDVADGAFRGVNLWYEIQRAWALLKGRPPPGKTSPDTSFREIRGTAVIRDGKLVNDDLVAGLETLGLTGRGEVDLAAKSLDYRLEATVYRQAVDEATGQVSELAGARVPLRLSGELSAPSVKVDLEGIAKRQAEKKVLEKLGVEEEDGKSLEDAAKEKAREKLKKLFGGGDG